MQQDERLKSKDHGMPKVSVSSESSCSNLHRLFNMGNLLGMSPFARAAQWVILLQTRANFFFIPDGRSSTRCRNPGRKVCNILVPSPLSHSDQIAGNIRLRRWTMQDIYGSDCQASLSAAMSHIGDLTHLIYQHITVSSLLMGAGTYNRITESSKSFFHLGQSDRFHFIWPCRKNEYSFF